MRLWAWLAGFCVLLASCNPAAKPSIGAVHVGSPPGLLDERDLSGRLQTMLGKQFSPGAARTLFVDVDVDIDNEDRNQHVLWWVRVSEVEAGSLRALGSATAEGRGVQDAFHVVPSLVQQALSEAHARPPNGNSVHEDINHQDDVRAHAAMAAAAVAQDKGAVEPLLLALNQGRLPAADALMFLGDARTIDVAIARAHNQSGFVRRRCIDIVRDVNEPRVNAWLFTMSTGHPDDAVRTYAQRALDAHETSSPAVAAR
jgi:hypothetical protein